MEKISWKKEYEIGVPEIDSQHQFFVGIIQRLMRLMPMIVIRIILVC